MKNTVKIAVLLCLAICVLLSVVSCEMLPFDALGTTTGDEATGETTPEETTSDEMYVLQMQTVFEMAKNAGYTGTLEELIAMFRGEAGPAGKDGVTPHIGENGNWWVGDTDLGVSAQGVQGEQGPQGPQGEQGSQGEQGPQGEPGRGILKMEIVNGELIVYYTDGTSQNLGPIVGGTPSVPDVTTPETTTPEETPPEETTPEQPPVVTPPEDLPYEMPEKVDMGGYTYRAYVRSNVSTGNPLEDGNPAFYCEDFWYDPSNGEPEDALSYSVYIRNKEIEKNYNVKIRQVNQTQNMTSELGVFYQNAETFDLTIILAKSAAVAATQNLLTDLNSLSNLNLDHEAYDQNSINEFSIAGKLYFLSGDMNISTMDSLVPMVVNMELYENYVEAFIEYFDGDPLYADVYNLVMANKWTVDTMLEMATMASADADTSDGALGASEMDAVGYFQYNAAAICYFYGMGGRITEMNDEGVPEFVINSSNGQNLFNYLFDNLHPEMRAVPYPNGYSGARKQCFITNANTLFTEMHLWDIRKDLYWNGSFEYGILPSPTYEEGDDYHSVVHFSNTVHLWAIPFVCQDLEKAQIMMDVMAAYSNINKPDSTMDGYYTRTLYLTVSPNPQARATMNILRDTMVYDIATLYDWGGWVSEFDQLWYKTKTNNYAYLVTSLQHAYAQLEETIEQFENPEFTLG